MSRARLTASTALACLVAAWLVACSGDDGDGANDGAPAGPTAAAGATGGPGGASGGPGAAIGGDPANDQVVATGLESPWGVAFLPNGAALVAERDSGRILLLPAGDGDAHEAPRPVGTLPGVYHVSESGLLGLAVSPGYDEDHLVYAYFTTDSDNRIVRFTLDGAGPGEQPRMGPVQPILTGLAAAPTHDGGRIAFGPDGMLYAGVGDARPPALAQDPESRNGKILRLRPDRSVPPDNPRPDSLVYSLGHRNVQGLAWDSLGRLWATEFGQNRFDEINLIRPGANYGWPVVEGIGDTDGGRYTNPPVTWTTDESSPSGAAVVDDTLYVAALRGERLWAVELRPAVSSLGPGVTASPIDGPVVGTPTALRVGDYGRLRTLVVAPDGTLWVTTSNTDGRGSPAEDDDRIIALR
ncbi:PQQ-dependent sugar dehydrogenase [Frankia nepalensis]|uniref:PQQ-dependent sugar dehydrogenase n=1 Tax=Frankia nepalensis TaxID=1836974 RepID=UPI0019342634|nr:PQQ-dependent sugar dehydrogenase [Frankia nepalensis]